MGEAGLSVASIAELFWLLRLGGLLLLIVAALIAVQVAVEKWKGK
jgi:hypothetical protein